MKIQSCAYLSCHGVSDTSVRQWGLLYFLLMWISLFVVGLQSADAATYYTATNGNDSNPGTLTAPFRSIAKGTGRLAAGDTLYVRGGTYNEAVTVYQSGTAAAPITIQAYPNEIPIMDGQNRYPGSAWYALIYLVGNYIDVSGITLINSAQLGMVLYGHHDSAHKITVRGAVQNGIFIQGDYGLVEDSEVSQSCLSNVNGSGGGMWASGLSTARDAVNGITDGAIIRRNRVFNNWGEGLSAYEAAGTLIEDNIVYDNWSVNLYVSDARNVIAQRNTVYNGANSKGAAGLTLADERPDKPRSSGNVIINNLLLNNSLCAFCWTGVSGSTLNNALIAHNTIVGGGLNAGAQSNGTRIANNLPNASVVGGSTITPAYFTPKTRATGALLTNVTLDFLNNIRSEPTTLGAIETNAATPPAPPPVIPPVDPTNLALNKPAVASSLEGTSVPAANAFDGNTSTRWASQYADPQWIYVDLGASYNVNRVKLVWEAAFSKSFLIQVSSDQINWTTIYSTAAGTGGTQDLTGLVGVGRYVRMYGQSRATAWGHSLWEMEVYGTAASTMPATTNLALNKTATASSTQGTTFAASNAFDGKTTTRWSSQYADPQWVRVDLGAKYNISRVKLVWEAAYSSSYKIQVSNDGSTWTDIYSTTAGKGGTVDLNSVTGVGRYIRMYGISRGTTWGHSLWEMEVYGTAWN